MIMSSICFVTPNATYRSAAGTLKSSASNIADSLRAHQDVGGEPDQFAPLDQGVDDILPSHVDSFFVRWRRIRFACKGIHELIDGESLCFRRLWRVPWPGNRTGMGPRCHAAFQRTLDEIRNETRTSGDW